MSAPAKVPTSEEAKATIKAQVRADRDRERAAHVPQEPAAVPDNIPSGDILTAIDRGEDGDAELFTRLHRGRLCFDRSENKWYRWDGHSWKLDAGGSSLAMVAAVIGLYHGEILVQAASGKQAKGPLLLKRLADLHKLNRKLNVLTLAGIGDGIGLGMNGDEWDSIPGLLGCENGVIELLREPPYWRFRAGKPEDYIKSACPTRWEGIDHPAPRWRQFMAEVFDVAPSLPGMNGHELLPEFLSRVIGYALYGDPIERLLLLLLGIGANGKGTFLEALESAFGSAMVGPISTEMLLRQRNQQGGNAPTPDIMALRGRRLALAREVNEGRRLDEARLKWITGHDTLCGRAPHAVREVTFRPTHTLIMHSNHRPAADPRDQAVWDRVLLVPFERRFEGEARDPNLKTTLKSEASGILAWAVRGWVDYAQHGIDAPDLVRAATEKYRAEEDLVSLFMGERCTEESGATVTRKDLLAAFKNWCEEVGERIDQREVMRHIKQHPDRYTLKDHRNVPVLIGWRVRKAETE
jgi:putative DNA primase/helicase